MILLTKSSCFNFAGKCSAVFFIKFFSSNMFRIIKNLFSTSLIFVFKTVVVTKPLASGIF